MERGELRMRKNNYGLDLFPFCSLPVDWCKVHMSVQQFCGEFSTREECQSVKNAKHLSERLRKKVIGLFIPLKNMNISYWEESKFVLIGWYF